MSEKIIRIRQYFHRFSAEVEEAINFLEWLENQNFSLGKPTIEWTAPVFRIVYGQYDPLSTAGSLAAGGRFNIGGAQECHFFPRWPMESCLYAASSLECAKKEAGSPLGMARFFVLTPQHSLHLWDLDQLVRTKLAYPALETHIQAAPMNAIWKYQKVPKLSQLLGSFLRKQGGDGIIFPSTKDESGKTLAFFAKDERHAHQVFAAHEILQ